MARPIVFSVGIAVVGIAAYFAYSRFGHTSAGAIPASAETPAETVAAAADTRRPVEQTAEVALRRELASLRQEVAAVRDRPAKAAEPQDPAPPAAGRPK